MAKDPNPQLRNLIAGYGDSIRLSDIKANIAVLFVAIMMGAVLGLREFYPWRLSVPVLLAPFIARPMRVLVPHSLLEHLDPRSRPYTRDGDDPRHGSALVRNVVMAFFFTLTRGPSRARRTAAM